MSLRALLDGSAPIEPTDLYFPMLSLVLFTVVVGGRLFWLRRIAVRRGDVRLSYFRCFNSGQQPESLAAAQRAYGNLFEVPPLFYVLCTLLIAMHQGDALYLGLAWAYVLARVAQGVIHLGYNNVLHRAACYFLSLFLLVFMWVRLGWELRG